MNIPKTALVFCWLLSATVVPNAQMPNVNPQVRTRATADGKVTVVEIAAQKDTWHWMGVAISSSTLSDFTEIRKSQTWTSRNNVCGSEYGGHAS